MNSISRLGFVAIALTFLSVGCGGGVPGGQPTVSALRNDIETWTPYPDLPPMRNTSSPHYATSSSGLMYVGENASVGIFPLAKPNKKPIGSITSGMSEPWGLSVDANNALYVANFGDGKVNVFASGSTQPSMTYSGGPDEALYALADSTGHVYVSGKDPAHHNRGHVVEYATGTNTVIASTLLGSEADGIAEDAQGNLYVAYRHTGPNCSIAEFAPGLTNKKLLGMVINRPQGLVVDSSGNIVVAESVLNNIKVFPPGATTPSVTINLEGIGHLAEFAWQNSQTTLYVSSENGYVYSMPYPLTPSTVPTEFEKTSSFSNGVAVSNPQ